MGAVAKQLPINCEGCARILYHSCTAFSHPEELWRKECWAYQPDIAVVRKELSDIVSYTQQLVDRTFDPTLRHTAREHLREAEGILKLHDDTYDKVRKREREDFEVHR